MRPWGGLCTTEGPTPALRNPSGGGIFLGSLSSCLAAPRAVKTASPLGQGGLQGGFERGNKPTPRCAPLSRWFNASPSSTAHKPPPQWPLAPASSTEEGSLFSRGDT